MKVSNIAPFGVRMPPELKKRLEESAKTHNRSLNSEVVFWLQKAMDEEAGKSKQLQISFDGDSVHKEGSQLEFSTFDPSFTNVDLGELNQLMCELRRLLSKRSDD
ncbi:Arc family DNA-binding protein [Aeromonas veronii]